MARSSYLQRLATRSSADPANGLTPARLLFPPRSQLLEEALPTTLHETSSTTESQPAGAAADAVSASASPNLSATTASVVSAAPTLTAAAPEQQPGAAYGPPSHRASGATAVPPRRSFPEQPKAHVLKTGAAAQRPAAANISASVSAATALPPAEASPRVEPARVAPPPPPHQLAEAAPRVEPARVELTPPSPHRSPREPATAGSGGVHIGHLEVRIVPSQSPPTRTPVRRVMPRSSPARLARGFSSFGLAQV
jgi:hypothetical protein